MNPRESKKKIIEFNNDQRRALHLAVAADLPVEDALKKYDGLFNPKAKGTMQNLVTDTGGKVEQIRKQLKGVYGVELSMLDPIPEKTIRIHEISKSLSSIEVKKDHETIVRESEKDMDVIDHEVEKALDKKRPMPEYHDVHLQVRYDQYLRETPVLTQDYYNTTRNTKPQDPDYLVTVGWTETHYYSRTVTKQRYNEETKEMEDYDDVEEDSVPSFHTQSYTVDMSVEEVLLNQSFNHADKTGPLPPASPPFNPGWDYKYSSQGPKHLESFNEGKVKAILARGSKARDKEGPIRGKINKTIESVDSLINEGNYSSVLKSPQKQKEILHGLQTLNHDLETIKKDLNQYVSWQGSAISNQWSHDTLPNFQQRNGRLLNRYGHLIKRIDRLHEQVRRQIPHLSMQYTLPDYTQELAELKKYYARIRSLQVALVAAAARAGVGYAYNQDEADEYAHNKWQGFKRKVNALGVPVFKEQE